jgi:hypothetical protein
MMLSRRPVARRSPATASSKRSAIEPWPSGRAVLVVVSELVVVSKLTG